MEKVLLNWEIDLKEVRSAYFKIIIKMTIVLLIFGFLDYYLKIRHEGASLSYNLIRIFIVNFTAIVAYIFILTFAYFEYILRTNKGQRMNLALSSDGISGLNFIGGPKFGKWHQYKYFFKYSNYLNPDKFIGSSSKAASLSISPFITSIISKSVPLGESYMVTDSTSYDTIILPTTKDNKNQVRAILASKLEAAPPARQYAGQALGLYLLILFILFALMFFVNWLMAAVLRWY